MEIFYTHQFRKDFRKLSKNIQLRAVEREEWFLADLFDSRLKTHQLKGKLSDFYSFLVTDSYRILFSFGKRKELVEFVRVGQHTIYD
jgi:addiction module RelE/StbE family toxin